jgi:hypothetical protein
MDTPERRSTVVRALAALVLLGVATACGRPSAAAPASPTPALAPRIAAPTSPALATPAPTPVQGVAGRKPSTLLRPGVEPVGLVVPEGGTARFAVVLTNTEPEPVAVEGLPPTLTLGTAIGEAVRTFPGGTGVVTIPPGGAYRHEVVWDLRRDDGTPAHPGRYGGALSTLVVRHAGGTSNLTMGLGTEWAVVVDPAGGVHTGILPLAAAAADQGTTLTLDRLALGPTEARLEAHATPAWPNNHVPRGSPIGDWRVDAEVRLDGGPPIRLVSPGSGVDDPTRTSLTWRLDAVPAAARELELTVRVSGDLTRRWAFRVPLPATPAAATTLIPPGARRAPPIPTAPPSGETPPVGVPAATPGAPGATPRISASEIAAAQAAHPIGGKIASTGAQTTERIELLPSREVNGRLKTRTGMPDDALLYLVTVRGDFWTSFPPGPSGQPNVLRANVAYRVYDANTGHLLVDAMGPPVP